MDYLSDNWTKDVIQRVGISEHSATKALDEVMREYQKTNDMTVFSALENLENTMLEVIKKSFSKYYKCLGNFKPQLGTIAL